MLQWRCAVPSLRACTCKVAGSALFQGRALLIRGSSRKTLPACRASEDKAEDSDFETLFAKELKRRGLESGDSVDFGADPVQGPPADVFSDAVKKDPFQGPSPTKTRARTPPPPSFIPGAPTELDGQRERSFSMVNEGLEGLIPRGTLLLQLGGSLFLAFLPFMLAFSVLFTGVYLVFGDSFLHGGQVGHGAPPYVDPEFLLSNPTVDPYVPYR